MASLEEMMDLQKRLEEAKTAQRSSEYADVFAGAGSAMANKPTYASIMLNRPSQKVDFSGFKGGEYEKPQDIKNLMMKYDEARKDRESNLEVEKMKEDRRLKERKEDLDAAYGRESRGYAQQKALKEMDLANDQAKKNPKDFEGRLAKLNSSDKARFDNLQMGLNGIRDMDAALAADNNTFSLIGDNAFTESQRRTAEAFGRMQSGGAINKDEETRFIKAGPGPTDSKEMQARKLQKQQQMFEERAKTLGFTPEEVGGGFKLSYGTGKEKDSGLLGVSSAQANSKVKVSNGKETLMIDRSDLEDAKKDGYKEF